jgi:hypothetical protein
VDLDDIDKFVNLAQGSHMQKAAALNNHAREYIEFLRKSLRERSARLSPVDLAEYTGIAFELAFAGANREDKLAKAIARGVSVRERMASEEGGSMSAEEAARLLGVTKQSALNMYHAGKLLGWRTEKQAAVRFPVWQFHEGRRLPGIEDVLEKLSAANKLDEWGKIGFFLQSHRLSDDRRPLDLLREDKLDQVLRIAEAYAE